jgi:VanZ family protein
MGTIFFLSHQSGDTLVLPSFPGADKLAHMTAYAVLALTVLWGFGKKGMERQGRTLFITVLFCLLYGVTDEYHQSFIPHRSVSVFDILADTAGAFGLCIMWLKNPELQQKLMRFQKLLLKWL